MSDSFRGTLTRISKTLSEFTLSSPSLQITFNPDNKSKLRMVPLPENEKKHKDEEDELVPVYQNGNNITGAIDIFLPNKVKALECEEVSVYLVGQVVSDAYDKDPIFLSEKIILSGDETFKENAEFDFKFKKAHLPRDSYYGNIVACKYFIRAVIFPKSKIFAKKIVRDAPFLVMNLTKNVKQRDVTMQVGVDDCLHIKFHYSNIYVSTHGYLEGNVKILSNTLKIDRMQIQFIRREVVRTGKSSKPEVIQTDILGKFEIMDGKPANGDTIPVRLFVQRFDGISTSQSTSHFAVRYYANLGLIDTDSRRYFKTCEIILIRDKMH